jgi:hypothetical protein
MDERSLIKQSRKTLKMLLSRLPKNSNHPIFITAFNNPTFVKLIINQITAKNLGPIIILDSNSTYPEMIHDLHEYEKRGIGVLRFPENVGPRFILQTAMIRTLPRKFFLTDPDLELNPDFVENHLLDLEKISKIKKIGKVGLCLDLRDSNEFKSVQNVHGKSIYEWEIQFWNQKTDIEWSESYFANIDTTFAFYDKKYFRTKHFYKAVRVNSINGKAVSARHLPWYKQTLVPNEEIDFYNKVTSTEKISWWGIS